MPSMVFFQPSHGVIARFSSTPPPSPSPSPLPSTSLSPSFRFPRSGVSQWPSNSYCLPTIGGGNSTLVSGNGSRLPAVSSVLWHEWFIAMVACSSSSSLSIEFPPCDKNKVRNSPSILENWVFPDLSQRPRSSEPRSGFSEYLRFSILTHRDSYQHIFSRNTISPNFILS